MLSRRLFTSLLALSSLSILSYADEHECGSSRKAMRASVRHIEGKGVGCTLGYTSFDLFLAPSTPMHSWIPFFDGRAHVFNNGEPAANAGVVSINAQVQYNEGSVAGSSAIKQSVSTSGNVSGVFEPNDIVVK